MIKVSGKELISWLKNSDSKITQKNALNLLLDLQGGITKQEVNLLRIDSKRYVYLKESFEKLDSSWNQFIENKIPIQYLCGKTYWRNFKLKVSNDVLIPRPETEQIIDIIMDICNFNQQILFADLGTGSGAIAISLAEMSRNFIGLATDINIKSLNIARENYKKLGTNNNLKFYCGDWWKPLSNYSGKIDIAVSNPPYVPLKVYEELSNTVKNHEPELALKGGKDGLIHLSKIIKCAPNFLKKGGWLIVENHFDQSNKVANLFIENGFELVEIINDYSGIGRFTIGRYK